MSRHSTRTHLSEVELQILDYQTQQYRIFVQISRALVFLLAANEVRDLYLKVTQQLTEGNTELLPELHALSSGLKVSYLCLTRWLFSLLVCCFMGGSTRN